MDATLIIPQFQQPELTCACLASIRQHEATTWPVIIVDDGSDIAHRRLDQDMGPNVRFVSKRHRGVTAAWNTGVLLAESEFIVLVNNDVTWTGTAIEGLVQPLREGRAIVSGIEWRQERCWPASWNSALPSRLLIAGWCWAFRRSTWRELGGFDESLALYFSDTDFQLRVLLASQVSSAECQANMERQCPLALGTWPSALGSPPLLHAGHQSAKRLPDRRTQWQRDRQRFLEKWA